MERDDVGPGGLQDWTKLVLDRPPLDIQQYVTQSEDDSAFEVITRLYQTILDYWDEAPDIKDSPSTLGCLKDKNCSVLLSSAPWLCAFTTEDGRLVSANHALAKSSNLCTRLILRLKTLLMNAIIMVNWKMRVLESFAIWNLNDTSHSAQQVGSVIRHHVRIRHNLIYRLQADLKESTNRSMKDEMFRLFSSRVADFCLAAGCPAVVCDPQRDIFSLRQYLSSHDSVLREAELRREIETLRNSHLEQQRIIANLVFRHIFEMLPSSCPESISATAKWSAFFRKALANAQTQLAQGQRNHPLVAVLEKYKSPERVETTGVNLYGILSTNIHHFSGQSTILANQWNILEADILAAFKPLPQNETETGINWNQERTRF
jgi:hypothetical protein